MCGNCTVIDCMDVKSGGSGPEVETGDRVLDGQGRNCLR